MPETDPLCERARALEDERFAATVAQDFAALDRLIDDRLVYVHSSGVADGKTTFLDKQKGGSLRYRAFDVVRREFRRFGDVVISTGELRVKVTADGKNAKVRLLYTCVYPSASDLRLVSWHSTRLAA